MHQYVNHGDTRAVWLGGESPGTQARPVGGGTLKVADGSAFGSPSPESPIRIVVMRGENNAFVTILKLVGRSGETFTIDGPSDAHADAEILVDDRIVAALTAEGMAEIQAAIENVETTPGDPGADGTKWQIGDTAPDDSLGVDGDFYINSTTQDVSLKSSGAYAVQFNMKGAKGDPGDPGEGVPTGGTTDQLLAKASGTNYDTKWVDAPEGGGGLTSIGLSMPGGLSVSGSPLTANGSFNVTTALSGLVKASGGAFSAAVAGTDYLTPTGNGSGLTNLNAANIASGTLSVSRGGTGATTFASGSLLKGAGTGAVTAATAGTDYATPAQVAAKADAAAGLPPGGTAGKLLAKIDGTDFNTEWVDAPSGGGGSATPVDVATFLLGRFDIPLTVGTNLTKNSKPAGFDGTITRVIVTCKDNPAGGGFSFQLNINGTGVFAAAEEIAAEAGLVGGSAVVITDFANASFAIGDQFTCDCTAAGEGVKYVTIAVYGTPS